MSLPRRVLPNTTYFVTRRCLGRRFLLRPDASLNNLFVYCLALATRKYGVEVHALSVMSNHYHLVLSDPHGVLPDFMAWLNRTLAMSIKRLRNWDEVVWEPNVPYSAIDLGGPREIFDKLAYTLLNPVSAGLVRSPGHWPGVLSGVRVLRHGCLRASRPAIWFKDSAPPEATLPLITPAGVGSKEAYLSALQALLSHRLEEARALIRRQGRGFLGGDRVRKTSVLGQPSTKKRRFGLRPTFSALTRERWLDAVRQLREFRNAYRVAYRAWRDGARDTAFPAGTWWVVRCAGATAVT